jgi:general secretion pathway protein L
LSTLYIRLPSKAAADHSEHWAGLGCPFALVAGGGAVEREGVAPLSELGGQIARASRVMLLLAASDVSLLRVQVPPMSAARLRAALPNLVEEHLIADPEDCVVVPGASHDGLRTVAVADRAWLDLLTQTMHSMGARQFSALPSQLCLPWQEGGVTAAATDHGDDIDLALRTGPQDGLGLPILPDQADTAGLEVMQTLQAVVPAQPLTLYVAQSAVLAYQQAAAAAEAQGQQVQVYADNWSRWIAGADSVGLDLLAAVAGARGPAVDWRRWRWPVGLAAAVLVINVAALNIDWLRARREAGALRTTLTQIYKAAYPKETVIVDPVAQMRQKLNAAKLKSGQASMDDFTMLTAAFGEAWANSMAQSSGQAPGIAGLEYRDRSLLVRLKPEGAPPTDQVRAMLAARDLSLTPGPAQGGGVVWQIRSAK